MNIRLNKEKSIGKVLFIVEGGRTEPFLLHRIFCKIFRATDLYSLVEVKNVRKTENLEKGYVSGKYGAIPMLNQTFSNLFSS